MQTGFKYALEHGYDTVIRLDGDGQHDPQQIPNLLEPLERGDADVVIGSRFANGSGMATTGRRSPGAPEFAGSRGWSRCSRARR